MTVTGTAEPAVAEVRAARPARRKKLALVVLPPVAALVIGVALWQLIIVIWSVPGYLMPSPLTMARTVGDDMSTMWTPTWVTVRESYLGFVIAGVAGVLCAVVMARWRLFERGLFPYLVIVQTLPSSRSRRCSSCGWARARSPTPWSAP
jgi:NitT/TauT family transport system permease protein